MSRHDDAISLQHIIVHSREAIDILGGRSSSLEGFRLDLAGSRSPEALGR